MKIALVIILCLITIAVIIIQHRKRKKKIAEHQRKLEEFDKDISLINEDIESFINLHENFDESKDDPHKTLENMSTYLLCAEIRHISINQIILLQNLYCGINDVFCNNGFGFSFDDQLEAEKLMYYKEKGAIIKEKLVKPNQDFLAFTIKYKKNENINEK